MSRAEQREQTRARIVDAAVQAFAELGFEASSTRDIAAAAGVTQGLIAYHFGSKDELWRAAADRIFGQLADELPGAPEGGPSARTRAARRGAAREAVRAYVRFSAQHPEVFRFMTDAGGNDDDRMRWLVDTHLAARLAAVATLAAAGGVTSADQATHVYYALVGASSLIFAVAPECRALSGVDPLAPEHVEQHADLVARLFVP